MGVWNIRKQNVIKHAVLEAVLQFSEFAHRAWKILLVILAVEGQTQPTGSEELQQQSVRAPGNSAASTAGYSMHGTGEPEIMRLLTLRQQQSHDQSGSSGKWKEAETHTDRAGEIDEQACQTGGAQSPIPGPIRQQGLLLNRWGVIQPETDSSYC
ncbi:UNVERIFIED_CONTAM: hypothetical protein FKN15_032462 [Acipenser sinensis]